MKPLAVVERSNNTVLWTNEEKPNQTIIHVVLTTEEENKRTENGTKQQITWLGYASEKNMSFYWICVQICWSYATVT